MILYIGTICDPGTCPLAKLILPEDVTMTVTDNGNGTNTVTATYTVGKWEDAPTGEDWDDNEYLDTDWFFQIHSGQTHDGQRIQEGQLAWWPMERKRKVLSQVSGRKHKNYWAGHRDWTRGRHWDRRSRYGLK